MQSLQPVQAQLNRQYKQSKQPCSTDLAAQGPGITSCSNLLMQHSVPTSPRMIAHTPVSRSSCCRAVIACVQGQHTHETYSGDRTKEAFEQFADSLVPSAGQPHMKHAQLKQAPRASGCNLAGTQQQQQHRAAAVWGLVSRRASLCSAAVLAMCIQHGSRLRGQQRYTECALFRVQQEVCACNMESICT